MPRHGSARLCKHKFEAYEPSDWEEEWRAKAEEYHETACKIRINDQSALVDA